MHPYPSSPFDMAYGHSLLPRQLLVSPYPMMSPYPPYYNNVYSNTHSYRQMPVTPLGRHHSASSLDSLDSCTQQPTRSVMLMNLSPQLSVRELLDHVQYGPLESARSLSDDQSIVLTFLKTETCADFYNSILTYWSKFKGAIHSPDATMSFVHCNKLLPFIANAINNDGATRNVYISGLPSNVDEHMLTADLAKFGPMEKVELMEKDAQHVAFVHFQSLPSAIKAVQQLSLDEPYGDCNIFYGTDRCCIANSQSSHTVLEADYGDMPSSPFIHEAQVVHHHQSSLYDDQNIINTLKQRTNIAMSLASSTGGGMANVGNRTIFISNLDQHTRIDDLCNVIRGGLLQHIKLIPRRRIAFVTFIQQEAAAQFFASANVTPIVLHHRRLRIGWGKHPGQLPNNIALSVTAGASRNVYLGSEDDSTLPDEDTIREDFQFYGEIEQINFIRQNRAAFVNFVNIADAIKCVDEAHGSLKSCFVDRVGGRYDNVKISYGKDRCGNPPKKRASNAKKNRNQRPLQAADEHDEYGANGNGEENDLVETHHEDGPNVELFASMGISTHEEPAQSPTAEVAEMADVSEVSEVSEVAEAEHTQGYRRYKNGEGRAGTAGDRRQFTTTGSQVMAQYLAQRQHAEMGYAANVLGEWY